MQTGRYMHNTKVYDNGCGGMDFQNGPEKLNIAFYARQQGYQNYYAGKVFKNSFSFFFLTMSTAPFFLLFSSSFSSSI